jgi:hypothetical protein
MAYLNRDMKQIRKKWSGDFPHPEAPDLVLSRAVNWVPDSTKKYSTINGYEPNNIIAAAAWTKIPEDLVASDAFIYRDKKTGLWVQAVGYPLIPREQAQAWIELQMAEGAHSYWFNQYAQPRLPQKPYTLREVPGKTIDKITYIEMLAHQNKFMVAGINLLDLNPLGRPKEVDVHAEPVKRKNYPKKNTGIFHIRKNSKCLETPRGVYQSVSAAAGDMDMSFCGVTHHLKKNSPGYRYISVDEYLLRVEELNKNSTTE